MSRDTHLDRWGNDVDLLLCDYCDDGQADAPAGNDPVADWVADGWDIDPRPGRDRCPDCVTHLHNAADDDAGDVIGQQVAMPAGVP